MTNFIKLFTALLLISTGSFAQSPKQVFYSNYLDAAAMALEATNSPTAATDSSSVKYTIVKTADAKFFFYRTAGSYRLGSISGSYDALFAIWQKYFDNSATASIKSVGYATPLVIEAGGKKWIASFKNANGWLIEIKVY